MNASPLAWNKTQLIYTMVLREFDVLFAQASIRWMPIKGAYLISCGLAEKITARKMDDIDILVDKNNLDPTCNALISRGWHERKGNSPIHRTLISPAGIMCEVHYRVSLPGRYKLDTNDVFSRASTTQENRLLMHPIDAFCICVGHAISYIPLFWKEGLFHEIDLLMQQSSFTWDEAHNRLKKAGILRWWDFLSLWISREQKSPQTIKKRALSWYAQCSAALLPRDRFYALPIFLRRLLIELPFVRNPFSFYLSKWWYSRLPISK